MKLELITTGEINDRDISENISENTLAILLHEKDEAFYWIEISAEGNQFYVPDGHIGTKTNNIIEAIAALKKFIIDNN
jgi:hypothetical protein